MRLIDLMFPSIELFDNIVIVRSARRSECEDGAGSSYRRESLP